MSKQRRRAIDSSYPPVVITVVGWARLIGKSINEVCLSFAVPEGERSKSVGCCVNTMLPADIVVDWSPKDADLNLFPNVSIGECLIDASIDTLSKIEGRWSVVYASKESG